MTTPDRLAFRPALLRRRLARQPVPRRRRRACGRDARGVVGSRHPLFRHLPALRARPVRAPGRRLPRRQAARRVPAQHEGRAPAGTDAGAGASSPTTPGSTCRRRRAGSGITQPTASVGASTTSLERLGLDRVDILYLHDPEQYGVPDAVPVALEALAALRDEGLVRAVGVGTSDVGILRRAVERSDIDLVMVSNRYTLLDQAGTVGALRPVPRPRRRHRHRRRLQLGPARDTRAAADAHFEYGPVPPEMLEKARRIAAVCAAHGVELPAAALQYSLRDDAVRTVVVGSADPAEMRQNAERMAVEIPDDVLERPGRSGPGGLTEVSGRPR